MKRIRMIRLGLENLPVDMLGGGKPASLMMGNRDSESLSNGRHVIYITYYMSHGRRWTKQWLYRQYINVSVTFAISLFYLHLGPFLPSKSQPTGRVSAIGKLCLIHSTGTTD